MYSNKSTSTFYLTQPADYYRATSLCYNKHRNMTEKNYDYYLKKTKTDAEKRKQADPSKSARAESAAAAVFFLSMAWRRALITIWRIAIFGAVVPSLIFGAIAFSGLNDVANLPLVVLFALIHVGIIIFAVATFWRRGLWMVTVAMLVLAIFAFFVPFYTKKSSSCPDGVQTILPCSNNYYYNFYGQELNY